MGRFTYSAHTRPDHAYSQFHNQLDYSLRHFYGKANLATIMLKKNWLTSEQLHLLDHATVDVWPNVVWVKIPAYYASSHKLMFHKSEKSFCRFISKKDFLDAVVDYAQLQGNQLKAERCYRDVEKMFVKSASTGEVYHLVPRHDQCECTCKAQSGLIKSLIEDTALSNLLGSHPTMQGQLPDKHVFAVWKLLGANNFSEYQSLVLPPQTYTEVEYEEAIASLGSW